MSLTVTSQSSDKLSAVRLGIVLRGGGAKGLALLGAVAELERALVEKPQAYGGTSAGGLLAVALAAGYSADQLVPILQNQSFLDFLEREWSPDAYSEPWNSSSSPQDRTLLIPLLWGLMRLAIGTLGLRTRGGMFSTEPIGRWILQLLRWRPRGGVLPNEPDLQTDTRLGALSAGFMAVASSTGVPNSVIFSNRETPTVDALFAARCTMSIPGVFNPVLYGGDLLMDGGLIANFPLEQFGKTFPEARALGIFLCDTQSSAQQSDWSTSPFSILKASFAVFLGQDELQIVREQRKSVVWIDVTPIQTLDFDLSAEDKELLLECGRVGAWRWLRENADDPIIRKEAVPSEENFREEVDRLRSLRFAARERWKAKHRERRFAIAVCLTIPVLLILGVLVGSGFAISRVTQRHLPSRNRVLNVALVLNGNAEYAQTAARAFQHELEARLSNTDYVARVELAEGRPETNKEQENTVIFHGLIARFSTTPDYLVTIGTQVSIFARDNYLGQIPLIFVSVTDPVDAGLVRSFEADRARGNIAGVAYGDISAGVQFLHQAFPGARLGFYYGSSIRQDKFVAARLATCCPEVISFDGLHVPQMNNIDLLFGWYHLDQDFLSVKSRFAGAIVAGNEVNMTRGAVAMLADNDEETGSLAVSKVLFPNLVNGVGLGDIPVLRVTAKKFAINRAVARSHGLTVAATLPAGTKVFE
jgi:predicted acylesterase/phospholipase RssA